MKKIYVKANLKRNLKLNRITSAIPSDATGGIRVRFRENLKARLKQVPKQTTQSLIRTVDPYHAEEIDSGVDSLLTTKKAVDQTKSHYKRAKKAVHTAHRLKTKVSARKSGRTRPIYAAKKIKGMQTTNAGGVAQVNKLKTLNSKFVPRNKYAFKIKSGIKKTFSSKALKRVAAQAMKKMAMAVVTNPKVMVIGAIVGLVFFLLLSVTSSLGGSASSAGSFFMTDSDTAKKYKDVVEELNDAFTQKIESYRSSGYDDVRIDYMNEEGMLRVSWVEIFAIVAVKFEQDLTFTDKHESYMTSLFDQFNKIQTKTETYTVSVCSSNEEGETSCHDETRTRLIVQVYMYDMEDIFVKIGFNEEQREWARRLVTSGAIQEQFPELAGNFGGGGEPGPGGGLTPEEQAEIIKNIGGDINKARKQLIETAITLEGKVKYFWGGKSGPGWNSKWGTPVMVTAPGDNTTGTLQPYGLDCSGFIDWAFKTAGLGTSFSAGGTSYQWGKTYSISKDEMIPGDLIFKNIPGQGGVNHIGIFIGKDSKGNYLYVHCAGSTGVVINSYKGFKYPRRPLLFK
ncbi:C40 family peptidase [Paenibacillus tuaregi]|uniref:C40 family peptidase n=1 Tax=Paenibacillus tuaregi TaxID=1816681 RepID=UPI000838759F|nr:NlpC/P60 family protein [Paenibacillus tuaregi]